MRNATRKNGRNSKVGWEREIQGCINDIAALVFWTWDQCTIVQRSRTKNDAQCKKSDESDYITKDGWHSSTEPIK